MPRDPKARPPGPTEQLYSLAQRLRDEERGRRLAGPSEGDGLGGDHLRRATQAVRARAQEQAARAQALEAWRSEQRRRARPVLTAVILFGALVGLGTSGLALYGSTALADAEAGALRAEAELERALAEQQELARQLSAAGSGEALTPLRVRATAGGLPGRVEGTRALSVGMLQAVGLGEDPAVLRQVTDSADRVERGARSWEAEQVAWRTLASGSAGRLAITLGLASPPPGS